MIRGEFLGKAVPVFYDMRYLTFVLTGLTLFGLLHKCGRSANLLRSMLDRKRGALSHD
jgi:hypothetical protein